MEKQILPMACFVTPKGEKLLLPKAHNMGLVTVGLAFYKEKASLLPALHALACVEVYTAGLLSKDYIGNQAFRWDGTEYSVLCLRGNLYATPY